MLADGPLPPRPHAGGGSPTLGALMPEPAQFHSIGLLLGDHPSLPRPSGPPEVLEAVPARSRRAAAGA
jgi:hypothetical protein